MILRFDVNYPEILNDLKTIFVEQNGALVPYLVEDLKFQKKNFAKAKLAGVNTEEAAKKIVRANIYLPDSFLPKLSKDEFYFHEIEGFEIIDENNNSIGTVKQIYDLPSNPIVEANVDGKEVLLPLKLMMSLDKENKKIQLEIPQGILDL